MYICIYLTIDPPTHSLIDVGSESLEHLDINIYSCLLIPFYKYGKSLVNVH